MLGTGVGSRASSAIHVVGPLQRSGVGVTRLADAQVKLRHPGVVSVLLVASCAYFLAGTATLIVGRWRVVARVESGAASAHVWTTPMILGLGAAVVGAVLLLIFIASAVELPIDVSA